MDELEKVLYFDTTYQWLSYNTTFQLGDFYVHVSALIFRHIIFRENPCMPALFLIHECKFQKHHKIFFSFVKDMIKLPKWPIACVSDGEVEIIKACVSNLVDVQCWNHILQDCRSWLTEKGCSKAEASCYKDHLHCIFGQDSREKSMEAIDELQKAWVDEFKKISTTEFHRIWQRYVIGQLTK